MNLVQCYTCTEMYLEHKELHRLPICNQCNDVKTRISAVHAVREHYKKLFNTLAQVDPQWKLHAGIRLAF